MLSCGRRGARGSAENERAVVSLGARALPATPAPVGDVADAATPALGSGVTQVPLGGATLTQEDPAQPPCPSLGSVWRRVVPASATVWARDPSRRTSSSGLAPTRAASGLPMQ